MSTKAPTSLRLNPEHQKLLDEHVAVHGGKPSDALRQGLRLLDSVSRARAPMYPRLVDDEEVVETVERAVRAALEELDTLLPPGTKKEKAGINSNFQGTLVQHILAMLQGKVGMRPTHHIHLNPLFGDEYSFGRTRAAGDKEAYTIAKAPERFSSQPELYFSEDRQGFVELKNLDAGDLFTSPEAAVQGIFKWFNKMGYSPAEETYRLCLLSFAEDGPLQVADVGRI